MKLDYTITSPEERRQLVEQILAETPNPNERFLEILADYLVLCMEKQEKHERKLLTENRMETVSKRETSFEGLVSQFENGEDGIYNLIADNKNIIFQPKIEITKEDLETIAPLRQLRDTINAWEQALKTAEGHDAFVIKNAIIDMRKDQYLIKASYRRPITPNKITRSSFPTPLEDTTHQFDKRGYPIPEGITFLSPKVCQAILTNYSRLIQDSYDHFDGDLVYIMYDFDRLCTSALGAYPIYERIVEYKIDGLSNAQIQTNLQVEFGLSYSVEYISSLWRNKIPKLLASCAEDQYLEWYYRENERGSYKKCSRCGEIKLAHNKYFSKNKTSKDGFYSLCKSCRNKPLGKTC